MPLGVVPVGTPVEVGGVLFVGWNGLFVEKAVMIQFIRDVGAKIFLKGSSSSPHLNH